MSGRHQHANSHAGRVRRPSLDHFYRYQRADITPGAWEFTFDMLRRGVRGPRRRLSLDAWLEQATWSDESAVLEGELTLRRPNPSHPIGIQQGRLVRCRTRQLGSKRWREVWRMRIGLPESQVDEGTETVPLTDDLDALRRNRRDWNLRRTKRRKRGYFPHEVARIVARRSGVRLGRIAKGRHRIDKIVGEMTDLDALRRAYAHERDKSGRRFVIRMTRGRLEVLPYRRNRLLYVFGAQIQSALVTKTGHARPVTVIEAVGRIGKRKHAKKVRHRVFRRSVVRRYGLRQVKKDYGHVHSHADLRRHARRDLARGLRLKPAATFSHAGVPFIRRGEGIYLGLRAEGFKGRDDQSLNRAFVYTTAVRNTVSGEDGYTTEFDIAVDDPFFKDRQRREREQRERTRRKRRRHRHSTGGAAAP